MSMSMSMTARVCNHMASVPRKEKIGDVYTKDHTGHLQLFKAGQRIIRKHYNLYWRAGTVDCLVRALGNHKYEVVL